MFDDFIPVADRSAWERALTGVPHAFAHSWGNCHAMSLTTGDATFLYCFEAEGSRTVCPVAERRYDGYTDVYTPYGLSGWVGTGAGAVFASAWHTLVTQRGYVCGYFSLHPWLDRAEYIDVDGVERSGTSYVLDLSTPRAQLYAGLHTNRRRQLANFETISSDLVHDRAVLGEFLLTSYDQFYRARRASATYDFRPETFLALAALENVFLVGAGRRDGLQAVSMFGYTQSAAEYMFNVSLPNGRHHSASLIWFAAMQLQSLGIPALNLGGGVHGDDGVARFKARFGGLELPLRCAKQIYRPDVYHDLCAKAGVDPNVERRYFPAYRAPLVGRERVAAQ
jgi:hypothetical protein